MPLLLIILLSALFSPQPPKPVLLLNATVHLADSITIPNAALAIAGDSISLLGDARVLRIDKAYYEIVDAFGQHIYPGQIVASGDSHSALPRNTPSVSLDRGRVLIPRRVTKKDNLLREGARATLIVTDTLMADDTHPRVLRAFVAGRAVALPDSSIHNGTQ